MISTKEDLYVYVGTFYLAFVIAAAIVALLIATRKLGISHMTVQKTVFVILVVLKIVHLSLSMKELPDGGMVIDQTQLSFHLCSIMIYANIIINVVKNEKFVRSRKALWCLVC